MAGTSVLIAFRGDKVRQQLWDFVGELYAAHFPELEVVVGTDDGEDPFHKTLALNRAAQMASGDTFVITDADTWLPPEQLRLGIAEGYCRPYRTKVKLSRFQTAEVLSTQGWDGDLPAGRPEGRNSFWAACPLVLPRAMYEDLGGFDETFRGWGHEDTDFARRLSQRFGRYPILAGHAVHLWHPRIGRAGQDRWPGQTTSNLKLLRR